MITYSDPTQTDNESAVAVCTESVPLQNESVEYMHETVLIIENPSLDNKINLSERKDLILINNPKSVDNPQIWKKIIITGGLIIIIPISVFSVIIFFQMSKKPANENFYESIISDISEEQIVLIAEEIQQPISQEPIDVDLRNNATGTNTSAKRKEKKMFHRDLDNAYTYLLGSDFEKAHELFSKVLKTDPTNKEALEGLEHTVNKIQKEEILAEHKLTREAVNDESW